MRRPRKTPTATLLGLACGLMSVHALADDDDSALFSRAVASLQSGSASKAIGELELLADRGFVHPDASMNRAAAYLMRARTESSRPGDFGRAAAALAEALELEPGNTEAEHALEVVREEISRRRATRGRPPVSVSPSLGRAVVGLVREEIWSSLAVVGSCMLTLGLSLKAWVRRASIAVAALVLVASGAIGLTLFGGLSLAARHFRHTSTPAVVISDQARLLDARGAPVSIKALDENELFIPEGAEVAVLEQRGRLARVLRGTTEGWVAVGHLRQLARR